MERVLGHDLSADRAEVARDLSKPEGWVTDRDLVRWMEREVPLAQIRSRLLAEIASGHVVENRDQEDFMLMRNGFVAVVTVPENVVATVMDYVVPDSWLTGGDRE